MFRQTLFGLLTFVLAATVPTMVKGSGQHLCMFGCVKADARGLTELADALSRWAALLPDLMEQVGDQVGSHLDQMDAIALGLLDDIDRLVASNVELTEETIKRLMRDAVHEIDEIGSQALLVYETALYETECSSVAVSDRLSHILPRFEFPRKWPWESLESVTMRDFNGSALIEKFEPQKETEKFFAIFTLFSRTLDSADDDTPMLKVLNAAYDRQTAAYLYYCKTRSGGGLGAASHIFAALQQARNEYQRLLFLSQHARFGN